MAEGVVDVAALGSEEADLDPLPLVDENDEAQYRHIRRRYRELMFRVQRQRKDIVNTASESLTEALQEAEVLFERVRRTREAALDAQFLVLASEVGKEKANQLNSDVSDFNEAAYSDYLFRFTGLTWMEGEHGELGNCDESVALSFWKKIEKEAACWTNRAETFHFMFWSFKSESPARKPRQQKRIRSVAENRVMPANLRRTDLDCSQETEKEVERILGLLQSYFTKYPDTPVSYFEFVIDPTSFARSVENIFHVSFIIRDGFARMELDQDRLPVLQPPTTSHGTPPNTSQGTLTPNTSQMDEEHDSSFYRRKQGVISLSLQDWKNIVAIFQISEPMIKHLQ